MKWRFVAWLFFALRSAGAAAAARDRPAATKTLSTRRGDDVQVVRTAYKNNKQTKTVSVCTGYNSSCCSSRPIYNHWFSFFFFFFLSEKFKNREFSYCTRCPSVNVSLFSVNRIFFAFFFFSCLRFSVYLLYKHWIKPFGVLSRPVKRVLSLPRVQRRATAVSSWIFLRCSTMADKDGDEVELTIADEAVVTKYKTAGEIANRKWSTAVFPPILNSSRTRRPAIMAPERLVPIQRRLVCSILLVYSSYCLYF